MGAMSAPCLLRHAIDVTANVAVTESSHWKISRLAVVGKKIKAWLTVDIGCNRHLGLSDIASVQESVAKTQEIKKRAAVAGGSRVYREASNRVDRSHSVSRTLDTPQ
jgi:hypothetical protein